MNPLMQAILSTCAPDIGYVDDVFSAWTRLGTGSSAAISTNVGMTNGFLITKARSAATGWRFTDTDRGATKSLDSSSTAGEATEAQGITAFGQSGYTVGTDTDYNNSTGPVTYVDYGFKEKEKFCKKALVVVSGSNQTVDLSSLGTVGMVAVKRIDSTSAWYVFHRSCASGKLVYLNTTAAETTDGSITLSGTTLTLVQATIGNGTFVVYALAHDTSATGLIQCGSYSNAAPASVTLNWEPQFLMVHNITDGGNWKVMDVSRNWREYTNASPALYANSSAAEAANDINCGPTATGFKIDLGGAGGSTIIYLAIRRPNKPPTSGTQVFNAIARTGTGAAATVSGVGFAPDVSLSKRRGSGGWNWMWFDRLRGVSKYLQSDGAGAEYTDTSVIASYDPDGFTLGTDATSQVNGNGASIGNWFFRRAPGVFDQICFDGTGANKTEAHNLLAAPELWSVKERDAAGSWVWGSSQLANTEKIIGESPNGKVTDATAWNSTYPTATAISLGTLTDVNASGKKIAAYLWATLPGISKVFSYTGNGSSQTVNCGFSAGARFVMIIRTTASTAQDIFIWDSVRGIVAGNDPHLSLNTTAAEVTTDDSIDPDNSGFIVNELAATHINVNGASYIGVAIA